MKQAINEGMKVHEEWYKRAKDMTLAELPEFLRELTEDYGHDYGTICHAVAVAAISSAWAMNNHPSCGLTGFQAGAVMWQFIQEWNYSSNKTGLKIIDYDNFLYPQYEDKMSKTITKDVWERLQKEAEVKMREAEVAHMKFLMEKEKYEEDLKAFVQKYPDYYSRREYYDHIGMGTYDEHEAYKKKKAEGFEFAPREPYCNVGLEGSIYSHWKSIVDGVVPFGYRVVED